MRILLVILLMLCVSLMGCGKDYSSRSVIMKKMGQDFNAIGLAISNQDREGAKDASTRINEYINSAYYLGYREGLEKDAQVRYKKMEKRIFNIKQELNSSYEVMGKAYKEARASCISCHYVMRGSQNRDFLQKEVVDIDIR